MLANMNLYREIRAKALAASGVVQEDFDRKMRTYAGNMSLFKAHLENLSITIGNALLPGVTGAMKSMGPYIERLAQFAEKHPEVTRAVILLTAGLIGLRVAAIATAFVFGLLKGGAMLAALALLGLVRGAGRAALALLALLNPLRLVSAALLLLRGMLLLSGVGAVLVGLGAAAKFVSDNWAGLGKFFEAFGDSLKKAVGPETAQRIEPIISAFERLGKMITDPSMKLDDAQWVKWGEGAGVAVAQAIQPIYKLIDDIDRRWEEFKGKFTLSGVIDSIKSEFTSAFGGIDLQAEGARILQSLWDGLKTKWEELKAWLSGIAASIKGVFSGIANAMPGMPSLPSVFGKPKASAPEAARAAGGPLGRGVPTLVGEEGPEVVTSNRRGYVHNARDTARMLGAAGGKLRHGIPSLTDDRRPTDRRSPVTDARRAANMAANGARAIPKETLSAARGPAAGQPQSRGPITVHLGGVTVQGGANANPRQLAEEFGRQTSALIRSHFSDGGT